MATEQEKEKQKQTVQLQTKVSAEVYAQLEAICKKYGYSIFILLRMLCECIVRFMDTNHNLSDDLTRIIRMFEDLPGWGKSICIADGIDKMEIVEAFYVMREPRTNGYRIVWVERPMMNGDSEGWTSTYNISNILERFIEVINPSLYKHLRQLGVDLGTESMFDTIHTIANLYKENPDETELRLQFENNDWEHGHKVYQDVQYQRRHSHTMDYIEQKETLFDQDDK